MASTFVEDGERICANRHREGWFCTRVWQHRGDHIAHTGNGIECKRWRGGRSDWTNPEGEK